MAEQRQPFRFRLPWLLAPTAPRPPVETRIPTQPTTTIPIQRPPFRPAGLAPAQPPPPQAQAPPRTESQPSSPDRAATQSRVTSQRPPFRLPGLAPAQPPPPQAQAPPRTESQPSLPSRAPTESRAASQPSSPLRTAPQSQAASQPSSPSRTVSQPQPALQTTPQPQSPPRLAPKPSGQTSSLSYSTGVKPTTQESSHPPLSVTQPPTTTSSQPDGAASRPSQVSGPVAAAAPTSKAAPETPAPPQRTIAELLTAASSSKTQTKEHPTAAFQAEQKQPEKQVILDRMETLTTSDSIGKQIKTMISTHTNDRNTASEPRHKAAISNGERAPLHKEIREDISKFVHKLATGHPKQPMDGKPVSVITLAGDNRGASMHLGSKSEKREGPVHIHRGYKINPDDSAEATTDGEGSSKERRSKDPITKEDLATKAYINSNIQSINNSIMLNNSVAERNPGVHLTLSRNPTEPIKSSSETESLETHKAEVNITPAQTLTYEPTVKRRCLRGLFMEPSDSDPDNPEKPRRHGCRYGCAEKSKDKEMGVH